MADRHACRRPERRCRSRPAAVVRTRFLRESKWPSEADLVAKPGVERRGLEDDDEILCRTSQRHRETRIVTRTCETTTNFASLIGLGAFFSRSLVSSESARFRPSFFAMASASSSSSALRRRGPFIPLIPCPDCGRTVKRSMSGTPEHNGRTYYKCQQHGHSCIFWHWELEYVGYLLDNNYLQGDAAVNALGWAEERREELNLRQDEREATGEGGAGAKQEKVMKSMLALVEAVNKVVLLLKIVIGLVCLLCVLVIVKK